MSEPAPTWAKVVGQSRAAPTDKELFARSECTVSLSEYLPHKKTPVPSGKYPVFFDLSITKASHEEIALAPLWNPWGPLASRHEHPGGGRLD